MAVIPISVTQNFLKESTISSVFSKAIKISVDTEVIDIGAGTGNITAWLLAQGCKNILAYELDTHLVESLRQRFSQTTRISILNKDFLREENSSVPYVVVANIPFNITTAIVKTLTEDPKFQEGYIVMQKEAAYRFGGTQMQQPATLLSTLLELDFTAEILHTFVGTDFTPAPQVTSVLFHIKRKPYSGRTLERGYFTDFVSYLFNKSVPMLRRAPILGRFLARAIDYPSMHILRKKPSEVTLDEYLHLFSMCNEEVMNKITGYTEVMAEQGRSVQKVYRTRNSETWRDMV